MSDHIISFQKEKFPLMVKYGASYRTFPGLLCFRWFHRKHNSFLTLFVSPQLSLLSLTNENSSQVEANYFRFLLTQLRYFPRVRDENFPALFRNKLFFPLSHFTLTYGYLNKSTFLNHLLSSSFVFMNDSMIALWMYALTSTFLSFYGEVRTVKLRWFSFFDARKMLLDKKPQPSNETRRERFHTIKEFVYDWHNLARPWLGGPESLLERPSWLFVSKRYTDQVSRILKTHRTFLLRCGQNRVRTPLLFWQMPGLWRSIRFASLNSLPVFHYRHLMQSDRFFAGLLITQPNLVLFLHVLSNPYFWGLARQSLNNKYRF